MNIKSRLLSIVIALGVGGTLLAQPKLALEINSSDVDEREIMTLHNAHNGILSSLRMVLRSGDESMNQEGSLALSAHGLNYTASPGYSGTGVVTNAENGIILRASGSNGIINVLTGGSNTTTDSRLFISETGSIGINTAVPSTMLHVKEGDVYIDDNSQTGSELIMKSPNGTCFAVRVSDTGVLSANQLVSCPGGTN